MVSWFISACSHEQSKDKEWGDKVFLGWDSNTPGGGGFNHAEAIWLEKAHLTAQLAFNDPFNCLLKVSPSSDGSLDQPDSFSMVKLS